MVHSTRWKTVLLVTLGLVLSPAIFATAADDLVAKARALINGATDAVTEPDEAARVSAVLIRLLPAKELEQRLWDDPERIPAIYRTLGAGLAHGGLDEPSDVLLLDYLMKVAEQRVRRDILPIPKDQGSSFDLFVAMIEVDPERFREDPAFRRRVTLEWDRVRDWIPSDYRRSILLQRATLGAESDIDLVETVAVALDIIRRTTMERRRPEVELRRPATSSEEELAPIEASFFSSPGFIEASAMASLLASVHRNSPGRRILLVADFWPWRFLSRDLDGDLHGNQDGLALDDVTLLPSLGYDYSPWLRDPMSWVRRADGGLHVVLRGNVQPGREADLWAGRALIQGLPDDLDERWGRPTWHRAELPFHNGQILDAGGVSWVSVHSLEPRILQLLGMDRLPVDRFAGDEGRRFVAAARKAAAELAELRGRPVRFVHALPGTEVKGPQRAGALQSLGGGAGIDLDSVLTLLPVDAEGGVVALVGDVDLGSRLVAAAPADELRALGLYGVAAVDVLLPRGLDLFLERVAEHLGSEGIRVLRLPLFQVSQAGSTRTDRRELSPFLITWNNVVLERTEAGRMAEGFASGLTSGDEAARRVFAEAGYGLTLHPPLVESIVRNGGYRCASQHVRRFLDTSEDGI